jgi:succinyl-diaminopimelate desuccinylase
MAAIKRAGIQLKGSLVLAATADEEAGGALGTGYLVNNGYLDADWAIMEGFINVLFRGCGGMLALRLSVDGRSAHTSTPWLGINAIEKASHAIAELEAFEEELRQEPSDIPEFRYSTLNIGTIHGGLKDSVVPEHCELGVDMRLMPGHLPQDMLMRIRSRMDGLAAADGDFRYKISEVRSEEPYLSDLDSPIAHAVQNALKAVRDQEAPIWVSRGGSDAKWFIRKGIPAIAFGPGIKPDSMHHGLDEHIEIQDFVDASLITALTAVELLS